MSANEERKCKYQRSDFKPLPVKLEHLDMRLNFAEDKVEARNTLYMTARERIEDIALDAHGLTVLSVESVSPEAHPLPYEYRQAENKLVIRFREPVTPGQRTAICTRTVCIPSDNILEGIYKDTTPEGCPQQYMSQCQQWGFQRIAPILDDCTAKCTMTTTIEADARYTHLISNGNISRARNPDGRPVPKPGDPSRQVIAYENPIPMAPYLFIACVGTWDVLSDEVVYPSGRCVRLEYLVPPGHRAGAAIPMRILKEGAAWQGRTQEYEYKHDVYRTICMEKSNFGGMENVGNTTIVTSAALIDEFTTDGRLEYAYEVIVHEFEHNQCGSDVTMETPFDLWLNEAFTCDVHRQFRAGQFDPNVTRLGEVDSMRAPILGPLAVEDAGHMGNIVRDGFNDPDELVDGVTYVKGPEVIRMLRLILGPENFRNAKNLYFERHGGGNANTDQFFKCFEEVSGRDLSQFRKEWLYTIGYPKIQARSRYDARERKLTVSFNQTRAGKGGLFHLPLSMAAVDRSGEDIPGSAKVVEIRGDKTEVTLTGIPRPAFLSLNRDCSFYGSFADSGATPARLRLQIRLDSNGFNRVEAMRRLTEIERVKLIRDIETQVGEEWLETYREILKDNAMRPGLRACLLRIDEESLDRRYLPYYRERYSARIKLLKTIAALYMDDLLAVYGAVDTYAPVTEPKDGLDERRLKAVLLRTIAEANTRETQLLAENHWRQAWNISDRLSALQCINMSDHPRRIALLDEAYALWKDHHAAYCGYLMTAGSGIHDDVFDMLAREEGRESFKIEHPVQSRALFLPFAYNNRMLWTDRGIEWVADSVIRLAPINETNANRLVACFQQVRKLAADLRPKVIRSLAKMRNHVDPDKSPSVAGRIRAYLGRLR